MGTLTSPRALRTRERILDAALDLFERHGYDATTTAQIAAAAGVTPMTFFRHFPTKESVLVSDPFDPMIAAVVSAQPVELPAFERVRRGLLAAVSQLPASEDASARRRVAIVAAVPGLRAATAASTQATQDAIVDRLHAQGVQRFAATVASAACLAAITAALMAWTQLPSGTSLAEVVRSALLELAPQDLR